MSPVSDEAGPLQAGGSFAIMAATPVRADIDQPKLAHQPDEVVHSSAAPVISKTKLS